MWRAGLSSDKEGVRKQHDSTGKLFLIASITVVSYFDLNSRIGWVKTHRLIEY